LEDKERRDLCASNNDCGFVAFIMMITIIEGVIVSGGDKMKENGG
jgi:hypothetical protein